jgi:invasion protein IalB
MTDALRALAFALTAILCAATIHPAAAQERKPAAGAPAAQPKPAAPRTAPPTAQAPAAQPPQTPQGQQPQGQQPGPGWISRCMSDGRQTQVDCAVEQSAVVTNTGQLVASIVVRVPHDTRQPMMMIQVPVGLYLPAGVNIQVDEAKPLLFPLQTCDQKGCYAAAPLPQETLAAMKSGKKLGVIFQNLQKENITVPMPLENFAEAYQKIQ